MANEEFTKQLTPMRFLLESRYSQLAEITGLSIASVSSYMRGYGRNPMTRVEIINGAKELIRNMRDHITAMEKYNEI